MDARTPAAAADPGAVLVIGTVGVGKTTVAGAVGDLLRAAAVPSAVVDVDVLCHAWPAPPDDPFNLGLGLRHLTRIAENCVDAGITRLVLAGVAESQDDRAAYEAALRMPLTVCRLRADPLVVRDRLAGRHGTDSEALDWHLGRAPELDAVLDASGIEDHCFDVSALNPREAAAGIVRRLGWTEEPAR